MLELLGDLWLGPVPAKTLEKRRSMFNEDDDVVDVTELCRVVCPGSASLLDIRLKIPRNALTAESTELWTVLHEYSRRIKSVDRLSRASISSKHTFMASEMMVVPMIHALATAS